MSTKWISSHLACRIDEQPQKSPKDRTFKLREWTCWYAWVSCLSTGHPGAGAHAASPSWKTLQPLWNDCELWHWRYRHLLFEYKSRFHENDWAATWFRLFVLGSTATTMACDLQKDNDQVMLEQQSDSPFGLPQVTSVSPAGLVPAKRALLSLNLARKVRSLTNDGTRNRKIIFRGEVELSLVFSAVGPLLSSIFQCSSLWTGPCEIKIQKNTFTPGHPVALSALNLKAGRESSCKQSKAPSPPDVCQVMHYRKVSMFKQKHNLNELTRHIWRHRRTSSHPQTLCNVFLHQIFVVIAL